MLNRYVFSTTKTIKRFLVSIFIVYSDCIDCVSDCIIVSGLQWIIKASEAKLLIQNNSYMLIRLWFLCLIWITIFDWENSETSWKWQISEFCKCHSLMGIMWPIPGTFHRMWSRKYSTHVCLSWLLMFHRISRCWYQ